MLDAWKDIARAEAVDFGRAEPELFENLFVVLTKRRGAPCWHFRDAVHLNGTANRRVQLAAGAFERNDDVVRLKLWIIDDFLRAVDGAEWDVNAIEDLIPMRHWLRGEDL